MFTHADTVIDILAMQSAAEYAAKKYPLETLERAMLARPEVRVIRLAWLYAYEEAVLLPEYIAKFAPKRK